NLNFPVLSLEQQIGKTLDGGFSQRSKSRHPSSAIGNKLNDLIFCMVASQLVQGWKLGWRSFPVGLVTTGTKPQINLSSLVFILDPFRWNQPENPGHLIGIDIVETSFRVVRLASPFRAA